MTTRKKAVYIEHSHKWCFTFFAKVLRSIDSYDRLFGGFSSFSGGRAPKAYTFLEPSTFRNLPNMWNSMQLGFEQRWRANDHYLQIKTIRPTPVKRQAVDML